MYVHTNRSSVTHFPCLVGTDFSEKKNKKTQDFQKVTDISVRDLLALGPT